MKVQISTLFFCVFLIIGCKKYEENPLINLRSKNHRIDGGYAIAFYSVNGVDSTVAINNSITYNSIPPTIGFDNDANEITGGWYQGKWNFSCHKKYLTIMVSSYPHGIGPFIDLGANDWEITKLTDNHVHLKINKNNSDYVLRLQERN